MPRHLILTIIYSSPPHLDDEGLVIANYPWRNHDDAAGDDSKYIWFAGETFNERLILSGDDGG